ncbi:PREDICTED: putative F-box protein At3g21130 [Camelina sativa]|uniref:F-box protein At3g21130 n=1 Tax=Camelina sativa TaxID=90675 RepID=A0ABM0Z364_CAMSA|nr:PREDICTED: putative F-box protein At3g21130 [Camelina sativa]
MTTKKIPEDLVVEIFSRVPAVSLARLRSISKGWNVLIKDGRVLAKKHSTNASNSSLALMLIDYRLYIVRFNLNGIHTNVAPSVKVTGLFSLEDPLSYEEVDICDIFHCEGLLLCTTKDNRLVVWNPCSGENRWVQPKNSYKEFDLFAFGYDNKLSCYKILRIGGSFHGTIFQTENEIYDFTSNSWRVVVGKTIDWSIIEDDHIVKIVREIDYTRGMYVNGNIVIKGDNTRGMYANGNTYWIAFTPNLEHEHRYNYLLLSFDFSTEIFGNVPFPGDDDIHACFPLVLSVTREGQQLCILLNGALRANHYYIWIASKSESTGAISWTKFLTVWDDGPIYHFGFRHFRAGGLSFLADHEKEILLTCNKNSHDQYSKNIIHIMGNGKYTELDHHGAKPTHEFPSPLLFCYVPSLVRIQHCI